MFKITENKEILTTDIIKALTSKKCLTWQLKQNQFYKQSQLICGSEHDMVSSNCMNKCNKSNSTAAAVQVEANLQEELSIHLHFRKLKCCYKRNLN